MYPNQNVSMSQFYPGQSYSAHPAYPYPFYIQQNHPMNIATPSAPSQKTTPVTYDDIFSNGAPIPTLPATQTRFHGE